MFESMVNYTLDKYQPLPLTKLKLNILYPQSFTLNVQKSSLPYVKLKYEKFNEQKER